MVQVHAEVATKSERISSTRRGKRFRSYVAGQKRVSISQSLSDSGLIGKNPLSPIHLSCRSFDEGGTLSSLTLIFPSSFLILTFLMALYKRRIKREKSCGARHRTIKPVECF